MEQPLAVPLVQVQPLAAPPAPAAPAHAADPGAEVQDAAAGEEKHAVPATPRSRAVQISSQVQELCRTQRFSRHPHLQEFKNWVRGVSLH